MAHGSSSNSMTLDTYSHFIPTLQDSVADVIGAMVDTEGGPDRRLETSRSMEYKRRASSSLSGAPGRIRTCDLALRRRAL
jgi:hypothetical protein